MLLKLFTYGVGTLLAYTLYQVLRLVYQELNSPLRRLPGPESSHFLYGNVELVRGDGAAVRDRWVQTYGRTLKYTSWFWTSKLYTIDTKALNHFLTNHHIYQRAPFARYLLSLIVGPGVLVTEGDIHRRQRKIMNPGFGAPQIRELTSIFVAKSIELRDIWAAQAADGPVRLDALSWLNKATLDIIGLAGFNCNFKSLSTDQPSELAAAFSASVEATANLSAFDLLQARVPALRIIPSKFHKIVRASQNTMTRIGREILLGSRNEIAENGTSETSETGRGRDLLSLLFRANMDKGISENQRLSEEEVLAQVPTFLRAGHETTSSGMTWVLFALTQNMPAQTRLRAELLRVQTDYPTMDELNALLYLDCVLREALRLYPPVVVTARVATQDDVVPLATPWTDANGITHDTIRLTQGQAIIIPIQAMNRDTSIWGADAGEFIPERWESETPISDGLPGVWGQMLTFLGGPRSCIGYRFALVEMKALLFTLIRAFEFELAVPATDIGKKVSIVQQPMVRTEPAAGAQLPLLVKRHARLHEGDGGETF